MSDTLTERLTVKETKERLIVLLEGLRGQGIVVQEIHVSWVTVVEGDKPKLEGQMKCNVDFRADL